MVRLHRTMIVITPKHVFHYLTDNSVILYLNINQNCCKTPRAAQVDTRAARRRGASGARACTVHCVLCTVHCAPCAACTVCCARCVLCTVRGVYCALCAVCTVYCVSCAVCIARGRPGLAVQRTISLITCVMLIVFTFVKSLS